MSWFPWGRHGEDKKQFMSSAAEGKSAKSKIEEYITESTIEGVHEMLQAYPEMQVGKFADFPTGDADLYMWLDELEEAEAQEICNLLGQI